jgi:hypothetical protein
MSSEEEREIEAAFMASWDEAEHFCHLDIFMTDFTWVRNFLPLIKTLRERGYDHRLRAKSMVTRLRLSRSREPVLELEQPFLDFDVLEDGRMRVRFDAWHSLVTFEVECVKITPEIENLLILMLAYPID